MLSKFKQLLRNNKHSKNSLLRLGIKLIYLPITIMRTGKRLTADSNYRSRVMLKVFHSRGLHQRSTRTAMDRYPRIFSESRDYFGNQKKLKILSFGCSTGEEVMTLRRYFPNAVIVGAEINRRALQNVGNFQLMRKYHLSTPPIGRSGGSVHLTRFFVWRFYKETRTGLSRRISPI